MGLHVSVLWVVWYEVGNILLEALAWAPDASKAFGFLRCSGRDSSSPHSLWWQREYHFVVTVNLPDLTAGLQKLDLLPRGRILTFV